MAYCPNCLAEYEPGIAECADCRIPLLEGAPVLCAGCGEQLADTDVFCDHCGVLRSDRQMDDVPECDTHPERPAVGGCVVCGRPVCSECARRRDGRFFCSDDSHLDVHQRFVVVATTSTDYEAAMIAANLTGAGIDARIYNQHDHVYFVTMGALALVKVMVPSHERERALEIVQALELDFEEPQEPPQDDGGDASVGPADAGPAPGPADPAAPETGGDRA